MTPAGSFRRRLVFGSVFWILGLLAITTAISLTSSGSCTTPR